MDCSRPRYVGIRCAAYIVCAECARNCSQYHFVAFVFLLRLYIPSVDLGRRYEVLCPPRRQRPRRYRMRSDKIRRRWGADPPSLARIFAMYYGPPKACRRVKELSQAAWPGNFRRLRLATLESILKRIPSFEQSYHAASHSLSFSIVGFPN